MSGQFRVKKLWLAKCTSLNTNADSLVCEKVAKLEFEFFGMHVRIIAF
jgi:hypothetical protein